MGLMIQHSYKNPSKTQDLGHVEAQVTKGKKYYDDQGWEISAPISDREVPIIVSLLIHHIISCLFFIISVVMINVPLGYLLPSFEIYY